ncbi:MAG TPA: RsmG family class I SAM-dependent methyltransferase [Polyangiales bacterium]
MSKRAATGNDIREKRSGAGVNDRADFSAMAHRALLTELDRALAPDAIDRLARYVDLVVTWNKKLDLTAARGARAQVEVLLADSLVLADTSIIPRDAQLIDVGSGAGAPALPLLLVRPDLQAMLIEPLRKRVAFLRTAIGSLSLAERARVLEHKLDPARATLPDSARPPDVAISRATFAPEIWLPAALALAPRAIVMLASQPTPAADGGRLVRELDYVLPFSRAPRRVAIFERTTRSA